MLQPYDKNLKLYPHHLYFSGKWRSSLLHQMSAPKNRMKNIFSLGLKQLEYFNTVYGEKTHNLLLHSMLLFTISLSAASKWVGGGIATFFPHSPVSYIDLTVQKRFSGCGLWTRGGCVCNIEGRLQHGGWTGWGRTRLLDWESQADSWGWRRCHLRQETNERWVKTQTQKEVKKTWKEWEMRVAVSKMKPRF